MTEEEIRRRLLDLEDGWTERKPPTVGGDDVRKALVAFANSVPEGEEAILFIGVADDGTPIGVDNPDNTQKNVRKWASWCYPEIRHSSRVVESGGKHVVAVIVQPDHHRPHFAGPAFVRVGSQSIKASERVFQDLIVSRDGKLRPLLEAKRTGEFVAVSIWTFGYKGLPEDCMVLECTQSFVTFQPKRGGLISGDPEQIRLGRGGDGKLTVEIKG